MALFKKKEKKIDKKEPIEIPNPFGENARLVYALSTLFLFSLILIGLSVALNQMTLTYVGFSFLGVSFIVMFIGIWLNTKKNKTSLKNDDMAKPFESNKLQERIKKYENDEIKLEKEFKKKK